MCVARAVFGVVLAAGMACVAPADIQVFDNGPFVTSAGAGPNGSDLSTTEVGAAISLGINANAAPPTGPLRVTDDFVVSGAPAGGLRLSNMHFYGVQSNSVTTDVHFGAVYVTVYDASPQVGGNVIAGDFTTNRLLSSTWTNAYRLNSAGSPGTTRPITRLDVDMSWVPALADGTYWIAVSAVGDVALAASPNPQTILVTPHRVTDNARQFANSGWVVIYDVPFKLFAFCPADYNKSHTVTVQDIFDFLAGWFAGNPSADFNGVNGLSVQDIFDFLSAWFGAC
jgi:hypothetical protein